MGNLVVTNPSENADRVTALQEAVTLDEITLASVVAGGGITYPVAGNATDMTPVMGIAEADGTTVQSVAGVLSAIGGTLPTDSGNKVIATPANGSSGISALRALVALDLPKATTAAFGAVKPDNATLDVSGTGGTLEMKAVAGVAGTYTTITSITIDGFGRVTAITGT